MQIQIKFQRRNPPALTSREQAVAVKQSGGLFNVFIFVPICDIFTYQLGVTLNPDAVCVV